MLYKIGDLIIKFNGSVPNHIKNELSVYLTNEKVLIDIEFNFLNKKGDISNFSNHFFSFNYNEDNLLKTRKIDIYNPNFSNKKDYIYFLKEKTTILNRNNKSYDYRRSFYFFYKIFYPIINLVGITTGKLGLIHSSGYIINNKPYIICAEGGVGKTSLMLYNCYISKNKASFIFDDIGFIGKGNKVYYNSRYLNYYEYNDNLLNTDIIEKSLSSIFDKIQWFLGNKIFNHKVYRSFDPEKIFEIKKSISFNNIFYLKRSSNDKFSNKKISSSKFADLNLGVIIDELYLDEIKISNNVKTLIHSYYNNKFNSINCYEVFIPKGVGIEVTNNYILSLGNTNV